MKSTRRTFVVSISALSGAVLLGCETSPAPDAGPGSDSGPRNDTGPSADTAPSDAASLVDAATDAGPPPEGVPVLDTLSSYGESVGAGELMLTATGDFVMGDELVLWNTPLPTTFVDARTLRATVPSGRFTTANFGVITVRRAATAQSYALPFESSPTNTATSNYVRGLTEAIRPNYGTGAGMLPPKGAGVLQTTTGVRIERMSDVRDVTPAAPNFRIIYSKWSSVNATGEYAIAEIEDSFTCYLIRLRDQMNLGRIGGTTVPGGSFGENQEPRWSTRGDEPNVIYYMCGTTGLGGSKLCKKDVVAGTPEVVVKDFSTALGLVANEYLYCDSEGTPSIDMRFWAFMRRDDAFPGARELVVYDVLTDSVVRCKPVATDGFQTINASGAVVNGNEFSARPNWVSMSPRGDRVQLGYGRVYPGCGREGTFGTDIDMPHTFSARDWSSPIPCAVDETHGAWFWGPNMEQGWIAQNNRNDRAELCLDITNPSTRFRNATSIADQSYPDASDANGRRAVINLSGSWNNGYSNEPGQHYMWQMSGIRRGFAMMGTDGTFDTNAYGFNNLLVIRVSDGRIWRAGSLPHQHRDYFSEVQWCVNPFGTTMLGSLNWQDDAYNPDAGPRSREEVYRAELPHDWHRASIWA